MICPTGPIPDTVGIRRKIFVEQALRAAGFSQRFQQICPTDKSPKSRSNPFDNNILFFRNSKSIYSPSHSVPLRGALANIINVGAGCGGRKGARDGRGWSGRASRVALTSLKLVSSLRSFPQATVAQLSPGRSRNGGDRRSAWRCSNPDHAWTKSDRRSDTD